MLCAVFCFLVSLCFRLLGCCTIVDFFWCFLLCVVVAVVLFLTLSYDLIVMTLSFLDCVLNTIRHCFIGWIDLVLDFGFCALVVVGL